MGKRKKQVSDKGLLAGRANWNTVIPTDLITEILKRLPAKSIARFSCVSKQWASILHRPYFTQLFLTVSSSRPRLLFALTYKGEWYFLSAPQDPDQNLSPIAVDHHKCFRSYFTFGMCAPIHGLVCTISRKPMLCNPSTGQQIDLPKFEWAGYEVRNYFGYDPINKIFKVLSRYRGYRVLTLGTGELSWRTIECSVPHYPLDVGNGICINGVLYYLADSVDGNGNQESFMLVCFDVRFEKFKFLAMDGEDRGSILINYKGRLGALRYMISARIKLLVLDDVDEQKWSEHIYVLPRSWKRLEPKPPVYIVGMTCTREIVLSIEYTGYDPFSIFYFNVDRNTVVRVEIELGVLALKRRKIYTFLDHIENVKLMQQMFRTSKDFIT